VAKAYNYNKRKIRQQGEVNNAFLNSPDWTAAVDSMTNLRSKDYVQFVAQVESEFDMPYPLSMTIHANVMDPSNWNQAMNGLE
jgi:hypothetical protein